MQKLTEIEKNKASFLKYLEFECGRSEKTLENYNRYLKRFLYFSKVKKVKDIDETIIDKYKTWLNAQVTHVGKSVITSRPFKNITKNYHLTALREFLKYMKHGNVTVLDYKYITLSQIETAPTETLTKEELASLLDLPNSTDCKSVRDKAILLLLLSSGLRVSELCSLNTDIDLSDDTFFVVEKKGIVCEVPLSQQSKKALQDYLWLRKDTEEALFVNNGKRLSSSRGIRLTPRSVQRIVREYAIRAGIEKKVTPQSLRLAQSRYGAEGKSISENK